MNILATPCNPQNYGGLRAQSVRYIVIHYTAGDNDTAQDNGAYFRNNVVAASAHWFVDDQDAVASVPEAFVAWHCGGSEYRHPECRNSNSIGVEMCSRKDRDGNYYFSDATIENTRELVLTLMEKYNIPPDRVIRHYDVTGKICPAPFVGAGRDAWEEFKGGLEMYSKLENVPSWARATIERLIEKDLLLGDEKGNLNLSKDMTRLLVILDRAGAFDK